VKFTHEGLSLWYGTEDAPAPKDVEVLRRGISVTIGVCPLSLSNTVVLRYRINGGIVQTIPAILVRTDHARARQYFRAIFPDFRGGEWVEYVPILSCGGRQSPHVLVMNSFPSSFRLEVRSQPQGQDMPCFDLLSRQNRFPLELDYLCTVTARLNREPEIIGETPEGLKVNWYLCGGTVTGPKLNATIRPEGGDWMTIRPDGIGILGIRATLETQDGALIYTTYSGVFELGEDGYQNFQHKKWPQAPPLKSTPRFLTEHPNYKWLNRLQCVGIGEVRMSKFLVIYDLYSL
jgi:hypothetical protein